MPSILLSILNVITWVFNTFANTIHAFIEMSHNIWVSLIKQEYIYIIISLILIAKFSWQMHISHKCNFFARFILVQTLLFPDMISVLSRLVAAITRTEWMPNTVLKQIWIHIQFRRFWAVSIVKIMSEALQAVCALTTFLLLSYFALCNHGIPFL